MTSRQRRFLGGRQFAARPLDLLESPAFQVLSLSGHRFLLRLEIEHLHHGGKENGNLPCTYEDFGVLIHRHCVAAAKRECEALGLVEVMEVGHARPGEFRRPSIYRLTYLPTGNTQPSDEWRVIKTVARAQEIAKAARDEARKKPRKKQKASGGFCHVPPPENGGREGHVPPPENGGAGLAENGGTFYISTDLPTSPDRAPPATEMPASGSRPLGTSS